MWTAAGVALVTIGLGGLVSLLVGPQSVPLPSSAGAPTHTLTDPFTEVVDHPAGRLNPRYRTGSDTRPHVERGRVRGDGVPSLGQIVCSGGGTMQHIIGRRAIGACLAVVAVGFLTSGCDWLQLGANSGHAGDNSFDTTITPDNVSTLTAHFSAADGTTGAVTPQAVVNGVLYASDASGLEAYSATGAGGCSGSPATCGPQWSYATGSVNGNIAVNNGIVYVSTAASLEAFDAAGHTNCSGSPTVCQPLWTASGAFSTPTLSNGNVYVTASGTLDVFDAAGQRNCTGTPTLCTPLWTGQVSGATIVWPVTVSAGIAYMYAYNSGGLVAMDATGSRNCSGTPKVCAPLWYYSLQYLPEDDPIVLGSTLYVAIGGIAQFGQVNGGLEAFDANGVTGCSGSPTIHCNPLWSGPTGTASYGPIVAGDGFVFGSEPVPGTPLWSMAADGSSQNMLWTSSVNASPFAMSGSVLYAGGSDGSEVYAFDAGGEVGCSNGVCTPLWSAPGNSAIEANGTLYVGATDSSGNGEIVAYGLPSGT